MLQVGALGNWERGAGTRLGEGHRDSKGWWKERVERKGLPERAQPQGCPRMLGLRAVEEGGATHCGRERGGGGGEGRGGPYWGPAGAGRRLLRPGAAPSLPSTLTPSPTPPPRPSRAGGRPHLLRPGAGGLPGAALLGHRDGQLRLGGPPGRGGSLQRCAPLPQAGAGGDPHQVRHLLHHQVPEPGGRARPCLQG